jgi:hypothetical protein
MATVMRTRGNWTGSQQDIKARFEHLSFEHYLMMFRLVVQMELGTCLFDFSGVSLECNKLLLELLHELDNDLRSHGQASVFPTRATHYPIFLLVEEEHRLNLARKDTATT